MVAYASPGGSDRWNKQGLSRKAGSAFVCLLKMTNAPAEEHMGLVGHDCGMPLRRRRAIGSAVPKYRGLSKIHERNEG